MAPGVGPKVLPGPRAAVLWTLALVGIAAGISSVAFALTNDTIGAELGAPLVIAALWAWTTVAYILCGMFAWWRRPASRIGPLMIVSGFVCYVVTLSWTTSDIPYTTGQAFDKLPSGRFPARVPRVSEWPADRPLRADPRRDRVRDRVPVSNSSVWSSATTAPITSLVLPHTGIFSSSFGASSSSLCPCAVSSASSHSSPAGGRRACHRGVPAVS